MKKLVFTAVLLGFTGFLSIVNAQEDKTKIKEKKKETQEIIIRSSGEKEKKVVIEIKGDKVTVNGKPMSDFKDDDITIKNKRIIINEGIERKGYDMMRNEYFNQHNFFEDSKSKTRAFLGVTTEDEKDGAKINEVTKESAAEKAGLKAGDIITKIGDKKVSGPESLLEAVTALKPKDEVTVYYKRDGKELQSMAILGERKESGSMFYSFSGPDGTTKSITIPRAPRLTYGENIPKIETWNEKSLGETKPNMLNRNYNENVFLYNDLFSRHQKLGLKIQDTEDGNGVKILDIEKDSPAEKAGLKKDDILTEIAGIKIKNTDEAREKLHENKDKTSYNIKAKRNNNEMSFDILFPKKLKTANL